MSYVVAKSVPGFLEVLNLLLGGSTGLLCKINKALQSEEEMLSLVDDLRERTIRWMRNVLYFCFSTMMIVLVLGVMLGHVTVASVISFLLFLFLSLNLESSLKILRDDNKARKLCSDTLPPWASHHEQYMSISGSMSPSQVREKMLILVSILYSLKQEGRDQVLALAEKGDMTRDMMMEVLFEKYLLPYYEELTKRIDKNEIIENLPESGDIPVEEFAEGTDLDQYREAYHLLIELLTIPKGPDPREAIEEYLAGTSL